MTREELIERVASVLEMFDRIKSGSNEAAAMRRALKTAGPRPIFGVWNDVAEKFVDTLGLVAIDSAVVAEAVAADPVLFTDPKRKIVNAVVEQRRGSR
jgi:hypothetical protein